MNSIRKQRGFTIYELLIAVLGVAVLSGVCSLLYVAGHFIAKFW